VPPQFATEVRDFLDHLPAQLVLDRGALVVAHAGLPQDLHAQATDAAFERAVYGPTTGERDNFGFPIRVKPTPTDWAEAYRGAPLVVHGHKAIAAPQWIGRTLNIDTNCSRGGALTAFRYPEGQFLSVPARATYWSELHSA
jgi:protein phosphatase